MKVLFLGLSILLPSSWALEPTKMETEMLRHHKQMMTAINLGEGLNLLREVEKVLAIRGANPTGSCGGINYHRVLYAFRRPLRELNSSDLKPSGDIAGPHHGFNMSLETRISRPRMQFHTFRTIPTEQQLEIIAARFNVSVEAIRTYGDRLVEVDIDYDWRHISNSTCWVRPLWGSVLHKLVPVPHLFAEPADRRLQRRMRSLGVNSFVQPTEEVRP